MARTRQLPGLIAASLTKAAAGPQRHSSPTPVVVSDVHPGGDHRQALCLHVSPGLRHFRASAAEHGAQFSNGAFPITARRRNSLRRHSSPGMRDHKASQSIVIKADEPRCRLGISPIAGDRQTWHARRHRAAKCARGPVVSFGSGSRPWPGRRRSPHRALSAVVSALRPTDSPHASSCEDGAIPTQRPDAVWYGRHRRRWLLGRARESCYLPRVVLVAK